MASGRFGFLMSKTSKSALLSPLLPVADLGEILKALVQLSREQGHLTDDDINDLLPDGMPDGDVDELYRKLRDLEIKIVELADIEPARPLNRRKIPTLNSLPSTIPSKCI